MTRETRHEHEYEVGISTVFGGRRQHLHGNCMHYPHIPCSGKAHLGTCIAIVVFFSRCYIYYVLLDISGFDSSCLHRDVRS